MRRESQVRDELRGVIERQMAQNDPPEVAPTFARLRAEGIPEQQVWALLAAVLLTELNAMARDDREFDRTRYARGLAALPRQTTW